MFLFRTDAEIEELKEFNKLFGNLVNCYVEYLNHLLLCMNNAVIIPSPVVDHMAVPGETKSQKEFRLRKRLEYLKNLVAFCSKNVFTNVESLVLSYQNRLRRALQEKACLIDHGSGTKDNSFDRFVNESNPNPNIDSDLSEAAEVVDCSYMVKTFQKLHSRSDKNVDIKAPDQLATIGNSFSSAVDKFRKKLEKYSRSDSAGCNFEVDLPKTSSENTCKPCDNKPKEPADYCISDNLAAALAEVLVRDCHVDFPKSQILLEFLEDWESLGGLKSCAALESNKSDTTNFTVKDVIGML